MSVSEFLEANPPADTSQSNFEADAVITDDRDEAQRRSDLAVSQQREISRLLIELEARNVDDLFNADDAASADTSALTLAFANALIGQQPDQPVTQENVPTSTGPVSIYDTTDNVGSDTSGILINTGDGDDSIFLNAGNTLNSGGGDDLIHVNSSNVLDTGTGDDTLSANSANFILSGDGDDTIVVNSGNIINAGTGDDQISANAENVIDLGAGNDQAFLGSNNQIFGGEGDDQISAGLNSLVDGGQGNDQLGGRNSILLGGGGDDVITSITGSTINGGTGDDRISLGDDTNIVTFNRGDGNDFIRSNAGITLNFGPDLSREDLSVTRDERRIVLSFKGTEDSVTLDFPSNATAQVSFDDGSVLSLEGGREPPATIAERAIVPALVDGTDFEVSEELKRNFGNIRAEDLGPAAFSLLPRR